MWPYIAGRPVTLVRCQGADVKSCFFQRHFAGALPQGVEGVRIKERKTGKIEEYLALSSPGSLVELAQFGVLEIHTWGAQSESPDRPNQVTIDLDPAAEIDWRTIAAAALDVRKRMESFGLIPFLKSTGGKGLHVVSPIKPELDWPTVKEFAHRLVLEMEKSNSALYLTRMTKVARTGKIYLDYLRNDRGATSIAPFSPRARAGAAVAMPMSWSELKKSSRPSFTVTTFSAWASRLNRDPWEMFSESARPLKV
jgi:bifunctional non-homologous end joining protein LigD